MSSILSYTKVGCTGPTAFILFLSNPFVAERSAACNSSPTKTYSYNRMPAQRLPKSVQQSYRQTVGHTYAARDVYYSVIIHIVGSRRLLISIMRRGSKRMLRLSNIYIFHIWIWNIHIWNIYSSALTFSLIHIWIMEYPWMH